MSDQKETPMSDYMKMEIERMKAKGNTDKEIMMRINEIIDLFNRGEWAVH
jgi:hypothetical protein